MNYCKMNRRAFIQGTSAALVLSALGANASSVFSLAKSYRVGLNGWVHPEPA